MRMSSNGFLAYGPGALSRLGRWATTRSPPSQTASWPAYSAFRPGPRVDRAVGAAAGPKLAGRLQFSLRHTDATSPIKLRVVLEEESNKILLSLRRQRNILTPATTARPSATVGMESPQRHDRRPVPPSQHPPRPLQRHHTPLHRPAARTGGHAGAGRSQRSDRDRRRAQRLAHLECEHGTGPRRLPPLQAGDGRQLGPAGDHHHRRLHPDRSPGRQPGELPRYSFRPRNAGE